MHVCAFAQTVVIKCVRSSKQLKTEAQRKALSAEYGCEDFQDEWRSREHQQCIGGYPLGHVGSRSETVRLNEASHHCTDGDACLAR